MLLGATKYSHSSTAVLICTMNNTPNLRTPPQLTRSSLNEALSVLSNPQNINSSFIKAAEEALLHWENTQPYQLFTLSLEVLINEDGSDNHLMILLVLKNVVHRRWKGRGRNVTVKLMDQEKQRIRELLLTYINNGCRKSKQEWKVCAALIAKVGRLDLPLQFTDLIENLIQLMCPSTGESRELLLAACNPSITNHISSVEGGAIVLNDLLEELLSKRLLVDKKYFQNMALQVFPTLVNYSFLPALKLCVELTQSILSSPNPDVVNRLKILVQNLNEISHIVYYLLTGAFAAMAADSKDDCSAAVEQVMTALLESLKTHILPAFVQLCSSSPNTWDSVSEDGIKLLERFVLIVLEVQSRHALKFTYFLMPFLEYFVGVLHHIGDGTGGFSMVLSTDFIVSVQQFLSNVVSCKDYVPDEESNEAIATLQSQNASNKAAITSKGDANVNESTIQSAVTLVWKEFFNAERIQKLVELLICKLMPMSGGMAEEWRNDPESFYILDSNMSACESVSGSAQSLYLALIESKIGQGVLSPLMAKMVSDFYSQAAAVSIENSPSIDGPYVLANETVLMWDAIYTAAGVSVNILYKYVNLEQWYNSCLGPALSSFHTTRQTTSYLPILRRRIIWLLGCYAYQLSAVTNVLPALAPFFTDSGSPSRNDVSVELTAAQTFLSVLYEPTFDMIFLIAQASPLVASLYRLLSGCDDLDCRRMIMSLVALIISYSGSSITDETANATVAPLLDIWENAGEQNLLRKEVLSILSHVAAAVGSDRSALLHSTVGPMIDFSLNPANKLECIYLVEDALALWLSILRMANTYNTTLEGLFQRALDVVEQDLEHLRPLMLLTEGYIFLGGTEFLKSHSSTVCSILNRVVGQVRPRGASYAMLVFEALLRKFPAEGGHLLMHGGIVKTLLVECAKNYHKCQDFEEDQIVIYYLTSLARMLIAMPSLFDSFFPVIISGTNLFGPQDLIELYFQKFDHVNQLLWKKIWSTLLLTLMPPTGGIYSQQILKGMDQIVNICVDYIHDETFRGSDSLIAHNIDDQADVASEIGRESYEAALIKELRCDRICISDIKAVVKLKMEACATALGREAYEECVSSVEPVLLKQLQDLVV